MQQNLINYYTGLIRRTLPIIITPDPTQSSRIYDTNFALKSVLTWEDKLMLLLRIFIYCMTQLTTICSNWTKSSLIKRYTHHTLNTQELRASTDTVKLLPLYQTTESVFKQMAMDLNTNIEYQISSQVSTGSRIKQYTLSNCKITLGTNSFPRKQ